MAARNLSEHLLDMVERDPRFIGLTASAILAWLKVIRLLDRNSRRPDVAPQCFTTWGEVRLHLRVSGDRLLTVVDVLHARGLLSHSRDGFGVPPDVFRIITSRPAARPIVKAARRYRAFAPGGGDS